MISFFQCSRLSAGQLQASCRKATGQLQASCRLVAGQLQASCRLAAGRLQASCRLAAGQLQAICRQAAGQLQASCRLVAGQLQASFLWDFLFFFYFRKENYELHIIITRQAFVIPDVRSTKSMLGVFCSFKLTFQSNWLGP